MSDFNTRIIDEFRENGGTATNFGSSLVLLHTVGAKSGEARINPVFSLAEGAGWIVIASKGGAPENPAWYHNLLAQPEVSIEVGVDRRVETVEVTATVVPDADYDALWEHLVSIAPGFGSYAEKTSRRIPLIRLTRR